MIHSWNIKEMCLFNVPPHPIFKKKKLDTALVVHTSYLEAN